VAEEYEEAYSAERVRRIARTIRAADRHGHAIAVHKCHGLSFGEFADSPDIDQFAVQYNVASAEALHEGLVAAWAEAKGRYGLNLSEAADHGFGEGARRKSWASAMAGAHVMVLGWTFDAPDRPSHEDLRAAGRLARFFESTDFQRMAPSDARRLGSTEYVLASEVDSAILYASAPRGPLGLRGLRPGVYRFVWCDPTGETASRVDEATAVGGDATWPSPFGEGRETAVWLKRLR
jgi:hypothetical protein